jgi:hypothetical protein
MPAPPRAHRRAAAVVLVVLGVLGVLAAASCSGGDDSPERTDRPAPKGALELDAGQTTVHGVAPDATLDARTTEAVVAAVNRYVDVAVVEPLLTGDPAERLDALFAPTVSARVATGGPDRAVLADDGLPRAVAARESSAPPITIDALTAVDGSPLLVAARFRVEVSTRTDAGPLVVARRAELTFEAAPDGTWLVSAYRVVARRDVAGAGTTTTTAAA